MTEETTVKMTKRIWIHSVVGAATAAALTGVAWAQGAPVKIGVLATLEGPFAAGGADGMRGAELAIRQRGGVVAGRKIEMVRASSNANPDVAVNAVRKLVEQDKVDLVVGPLSGGEGIAVKDYSKTQPNMTFINGGSGAQATTLQNPSPNFFRFNTEGAQWMVGLGKAAMDKGYKRVMVIAEDYAFPYSQVQGFMSEFCRLGGKVPVKAWVPLGGKDYSSVIARIPKDVDALLVVLGGADAVNFLNQYEAAGGDKPMMGGSITVSQDVLNYRGKRRDSLVGTISAGPYADSFDGADWKAFVADYQKNYPVSAGGYPSPSLFALVYYTNMKATLDALEQVKGDLSGGQAKYREALSKLELKMPTGTVKLDSNRQAIGTTFVTEVVKDSKGDLTTRVLRKVDNVDQMLGMKREEFQMGSRDVPACP
jgi:branched-chain amino acid transport system substrate-binding protein